MGIFRLKIFLGFSFVIFMDKDKISTALFYFSWPLGMNWYHLLEVYFEFLILHVLDIYGEVRNTGFVIMLLTNYLSDEHHKTYFEVKYSSLGSFLFVVYDFTSQVLGSVAHFEVLLNGGTIHNFSMNTWKNWYQYKFLFEVPWKRKKCPRMIAIWVYIVIETFRMEILKNLGTKLKLQNKLRQ